MDYRPNSSSAAQSTSTSAMASSSALNNTSSNSNNITTTSPNSTSPRTGAGTGAAAGKTAPFAYQTRLLERTSSVRSGASLSRNSSQSSGINILINQNTGSSGSSLVHGHAPRKWGHRVTNSLDTVRGRFDDRVGGAGGGTRPPPLVGSVDDAHLNNRSSPLGAGDYRSLSPNSSGNSSSQQSDELATPGTPGSLDHGLAQDAYTTPKYLKRRTMPAPIIASPLSPNTTGVSVETDSPTSTIPNRIHIPTYETSSRSNLVGSGSSSVSSLNLTSSSSKLDLGLGSSISSNLSNPAPAPKSDQPEWARELQRGRARSGTLPVGDSPFKSRQPLSSSTFSVHANEIKGLGGSGGLGGGLGSGERAATMETPTKRSSSLVAKRASLDASRNGSTDNFKSLGAYGVRSESPTKEPSGGSAKPASSTMFPAPYRSSYMSNKKMAGHADTLAAGGRRRLGNHLPRIASGDAEPPEQLQTPTRPPLSPPPSTPPVHSKFDDHTISVTTPTPGHRRSVRSVDFGGDLAQLSPTLSPGHGQSSAGVAGLPGRLQLKAPNELPVPTPMSRYYGGGSWADKQRHLLQAYEYLCHVGEAQQWIEGCLGEELEFGVVELEEGLRNGVVLAKLVRSFWGEAVVRKIYDLPGKDWRHSENINYFFRFVREVGLPEGFIFELTDLYDKKNLPKVIYCIHALSHLLARRGMAQRIGNLLGQLEFSDDQLMRTQQGLKDAGVSMPNFGNVGRELAKEINEPEVEVETEEERQNRLLMENMDSIIALQAFLRGVLYRKRYKALLSRLRLADRHIVKVQAQARGVLLRRQLADRSKSLTPLLPWVIALQALARGVLLRKAWRRRIAQLRREQASIINLQAQARGVLQRRQFLRLKAALRKIIPSAKLLQASARGHLQRKSRKELVKTFHTPQIAFSVVNFQAHARAFLIRRQWNAYQNSIKRRESIFVKLQAQARGVLVRRRLRSQMVKLGNETSVIIRFQAAARSYLARKRLLRLIKNLRQAIPNIVQFQTMARAKLVRRRHEEINKALSKATVIKSVNVLQAFARAAIIRKQHRQLEKQLDVTMPDVLGLQAAARGALLRREYFAWRDHLHRSVDVAVFLQAFLRGAMQRRIFRKKMEHYRANLAKVVKIQALVRAKDTREQYRQLTLGKNVTVGTIKNFVHLLDDSEADFQEEIKVERLRKKVVESIRENQALETEVTDLDRRIALVVQNLKSCEDVIKSRGRRADAADMRAAHVSLLAAHGDPFSGPNTLDHQARHKLELYQQLFYILQTRGEYLTRLFARLSMDDVPESSRQFVERVVLNLFGYGQDRREDFLLLKLFQFAVREEIMHAPDVDAVISMKPMYMEIALHYVRPRQITYIRETLGPIMSELIHLTDLDLECDATVIHRTRIELEEIRSGKQSMTPKDLPFREAIVDLDTRPIYIRNLQILQHWTEAFIKAMVGSTQRMPYNMRYLARETLNSLQERFPGLPDEVYGTCIGRLVFHKYIKPALTEPETFDFVPKTTSLTTGKKNLSQISKVLTQITSGFEFDEDKPSLVPLNAFVQVAIQQMSAWFLEIARVPEAEVQYHAHEFLDATVQPKPIYISPNEIYTIHGLILQYRAVLIIGADDPLKVVISELGSVPPLSPELKEARDIAITLELTNRFALVQDPQAEEKTLWVQAKRGVLAILRVQPATNLWDSLMQSVGPEDEALWAEVLETEIANEMRGSRRQPSAAANDSAYRLEDIRSLTFSDVKISAISNLIQLERLGLVTREDSFQGVLDAIAGDVRSKHRKRLERQREMERMNEALQQLAQRKKLFEERIESYHNYVEAAMNTMQKGKGKRRFVLPFTKQYFHMRDLQRAGEAPQFGSFLYSAKELYDRGILLSIDQYSPRLFDKLQITMSSNVPGVFHIVLESQMMGISSKIASEDIGMEDLLQAKYEKKASIPILKGKAQVNLEEFLFQINKKFYA
ncbi:hypothetical protein CVT24_003209 [Panaeolus cyanescens]|uniref:Ras-GAP domain-containing protein n=1 Tax=Panaeolus cyanescens TaxID=181874 RepID=A0A409VUE2_9AGAR|nr:hypothetical protein CVT24_003209 [Panaeolus cyanescens]